MAEKFDEGGLIWKPGPAGWKTQNLGACIRFKLSMHRVRPIIIALNVSLGMSGSVVL